MFRVYISYSYVKSYKKNKTLKTHWRKIDYRSESLTQILTGLNSALNILNNQLETLEWYDVLFYREEAEPIWGLAFIAFQNYINGSIFDLHKKVSEKTKYYNIEPNYRNFNRSNIELIIGLANFIKHKDDEKPLHNGTQEILIAFNLPYKKDSENSPIFEGLTILSEKWDIFDVYESVKDWRTKLFEEYEKHCL